MAASVMQHINQIIYNKKDVTRDLSNKLMRLDYRDKLEHRASSLELAFEDKEALFMGAWYPQVEDTLQAYIGFDNQPLLDTGLFFVDEITNEFNRSNQCTATIRALSTAGKTIYAERKVKQYVAKNFSEVAQEIAKELGYQTKGDMSGIVNANRTTTGLAFLMQEAKKLGKVMKIENNTLNFLDYKSLFEKTLVTIRRQDIMSCSITDKAEGRYKSCTCKWYDEKKKTLYSGKYSTGIKSGADMVIWVQVKDNKQAGECAKSHIEEKLKYGKNIELKMLGNVQLLSGVAVELKDFGKHDGKYIIDESQHQILRSGYTTTIYLKQ